MPATPPSHDLVLTILDRHGRDPSQLLQILIEVQEAFHYVPQEAMDTISQACFAEPRLQVPALVSFYAFLSDRPQGEYRILLSDNITDQMLGNRALGGQLCRRLGVEPGELRGDGRVSVDYTSCTGMGDQGPAALVNGLAVTRLSQARVDRMAELVDDGKPLSAWPRAFFRVQDGIRRPDVLLGHPFQPGAALQACLWRGAEATLAELAVSGLRGRGGAGFPAARKWAAVRAAPAGERYVLCNADEGEPGTFKDRVLLQSYADLVFEGMTMAGHCLQAREGILYIRGEYRYLKEHLQGVLARRRAAGLLGRGILGAPFDFDIAIHWGAGAYICGQETAMIESMEGRRGIPRKPEPRPVLAGFRNQPTLVNNVETFAAAALVGLRGGAWFARRGTRASTGTKLFSVSGDCARPGIYEYPWGVSCREILRDCAARDPYFLQVGGPSGTTLAESEFDRRLAFEDLPSAGAFMVFDRTRDPLAMTRNFARFFQHESCGLCTPCRVGTTLLVELLDKIEAGRGTGADLEELRNVARVMQNMSHCGLGATAPAPVLDVLAKFPQLWTSRLRPEAFAPAFSLDGALAEARGLRGRD